MVQDAFRFCGAPLFMTRRKFGNGLERAISSIFVGHQQPALDLDIQGGMVSLGHQTQRGVYLPYPPRRHATAAKPIPTLP